MWRSDLHLCMYGEGERERERRGERGGERERDRSAYLYRERGGEFMLAELNGLLIPGLSPAIVVSAFPFR